MTLINALEELKAQGITKLTGMCGITDINEYLAHAQENHNNAVKYAAQGIATWQYSLDHENNSQLIVTADGHHIIATNYDGFNMATYSDYETDEEMSAAFDAWRISRDAEAIANKMDAERPGELPHAAWVLIATAELKAADKAANEAFDREFAQK